jgi:3-deoxy-D-manno-octulosonic-acid transferase
MRLTLITPLLRCLYTLVYGLAVPFLYLRLLFKSRHQPHYRRHLTHRLGYVPLIPPNQPVIWLHAVSLGETNAAAPLIEALVTHYPHHTLLITNTTATGYQQTQRRFHAIPQCQQAFLPFDLPGVMRRFLTRTHPSLCLIMETEIWPHLLNQCHRRHLPVLLINARLSARSARGYGRIRPVIAAALSQYKAIAAQSQQDADHYLQLGATTDQCRVLGNLKYAQRPDPQARHKGRTLRATWQPSRHPTWIAASTHPGEETIVLQAFAQIRKTLPEARLILVPRHPERFEAVAAQCAQTGLPYHRMSTHSADPSPETALLLGDTLGELCSLYAAADVAFVGGTLTPIGGHNLIEPAHEGLPLLIGPHQDHITDLAEAFTGAGALTTVHNADTLAQAVITWLTTPQQRENAGQAAQALCAAHTAVGMDYLALVSMHLPDTATLGGFRRHYRSQLIDHSAHPDTDLNLLLMHHLQCDHSALYTTPERRLTHRETQGLLQDLTAYTQGTPLAYLTGTQAFWSLTLKVTPEVLIPRPDTESLITWILENTPETPQYCADLGTGSGAIALALASERPNWHLHATDQSPAALALATENAERLGLRASVDFFEGNWCQALPRTDYGLIVANPPYLADNDPHLPALTAEPQSALVAEKQGLADLETIITQAKDHLQPGGLLIVEHGYTQQAEVIAAYTEAGYHHITGHQDDGHQPRYVSGSLPEKT